MKDTKDTHLTEPVDKEQVKKKMANDIVVEKRRRKVREYILKGFSYREISEKLKVCYGTVRNDVDGIRKQLANKIGPKGSVLIEQLRNEINEKLKLVEKTCWQLYERKEIKRYVDRDLITASVGVLISKIEKEKDIIKIINLLKLFVEDIGKLKGMMVPQESRVELLRLVNMTINNVMKANKIIGPQTLNLTQINIGKVEHNLSIAKFGIEILIKKYVPEDKRVEAVKRLKELEWKHEDA